MDNDSGLAVWGDQPDDREFEDPMLHFVREAEAARAPKELQADAEERKATLSADLAGAAARHGIARQPGGSWGTVEQHRANETKHRARAEGLRLGASALRVRGDAKAATQGVPRQNARPRAPRRNVRGRPNRARAPSGEDGDPEPEPVAAPRRCAGCGADIGHRRCDARFCERAACRQNASRASRAALQAGDKWLAAALELEAVTLPLVRAGELSGLDALALVLWPTRPLIEALANRAAV